jgi:hypothetical protein
MIDSRQEAIKTQIESLSIPVESLRRFEQTLQANGQSFDVLRRVLSQYGQLQRAMAMRKEFTGREDSQERIATAEHILGELRALLGAAQTAPGPGGEALIIKTAPNTFRVTFAVPMRIAPGLTFLGLPDGVEAHVLEKTNIGFTAVFTPSNIGIDKFGFQASAEL